MFRIISGEFRRRLCQTPPDAETTRPIPDRVKESLFSLLRGHCEGATVFDCFAGTGPIGLEALSRGARKVVMVERDRSVFKLLEANARELGVEARTELVCGDALGTGALARCPNPVHLVFFDPPYPMVRDAMNWRRIRAQFEACIARLDDTGFAVLRTPWPAENEEIPQPAAEPDQPPRRKGKWKGADRKWSPRLEERDARRGAGPFDDMVEIEWDGEEIGPEIEDAAAAPLPPDAAPPAEPSGPPIIRTPIDLTMAGALGPETHVYHGMAIHLYMRKKA